MSITRILDPAEPEILPVLRQARSILAGEVEGFTWGKRTWIDWSDLGGDRTLCVCAEGAIHAAAKGVEIWEVRGHGGPKREIPAFATPVYDGEYLEERHRIGAESLRVVFEALQAAGVKHSLPKFNDLAKTKLQDVLEIFDRAIALAEERQAAEQAA